MDFSATFWVGKWSRACGFLLRQENLKVKNTYKKIHFPSLEIQRKMRVRGKEVRLLTEEILKKFT